MFRLADGGRFTVIGCSDFNLFCSYLVHGEGYVRSIMSERSSIGFNWLRCWLAYWDTNTMQGIPGIGELNPAKFPGMYDKLKPFCALAAQYKLYIEFTAFTGPHIDGHWESIGRGLQGVTNATVELCNENNAHAVRIDPNAYQKLQGVICSRGSNASRNPPPRDPYKAPLLAGASGWWDYENMHFVNVPQWPRQVGHNTMELSVGDAEGHIPASRVPAVSDENTRPDQDGNIDHFFDAAAGAALLCAGSTFHSNSGKASVLFNPNDRQFAEQWVAGAKSVPLEFQYGLYRHAPELETEAWKQGERVYQRRLGDGRVHTVKVDA